MRTGRYNSLNVGFRFETFQIILRIKNRTVDSKNVKLVQCRIGCVLDNDESVFNSIIIESPVFGSGHTRTLRHHSTLDFSESV